MLKGGFRDILSNENKPTSKNMIAVKNGRVPIIPKRFWRLDKEDLFIFKIRFKITFLLGTLLVIVHNV